MNESNQQRAHRVALGSLISFAGNIINIFGRVFLVPLFLKSWGTERYGEWLTLFAAVGYMSMLDLGIQNYVINKLNQCYSTGRSREYGYVLRSALKVSVISCSLIILLIAVILPLLPLGKWFHFTQTGHSLVVLVTCLLAVQIVARIPSGIITGLYRTMGEFHRGAILVNIKVIMVFLITGAALISGGGFAILALLQLVPILVITLYVFRDMRRRHPEIKLGFKGGSMKKGFSFLLPASPFFLIRISTLTVFSGSTMIVATQLGPAVVAVFSTLRTLAHVTKQIPQAINIALWPELTSLEARKEYRTLRKIQLFMVKIGFSISVCLAMFIHFCGKDIVNLWTRGRIPYDSGLMNIFLIYLALQLIWTLSGTFQAAFNLPALGSFCSIASTVLGLFLAYFLTRSYGAAGTVGGLFIAELFICGIIIPARTCRILGESLFKFFREVFFRALPGVAFLYLFGHRFRQLLSPLDPIYVIIIFGTVIMTTGLALSYFLYLNRDERKRLFSLLRGLIHSIGKRLKS
ncbi:MAG: lipopolysaccharide biosynthesis protein [Candidatus Auribacterota bacterium]|nr:lipopolysaccharide biosynthesis protein [Candidatus Auribacterota bacterium]